MQHNEELLLNLLEDYKLALQNNTITSQQRLLLMEFFIKDAISKNPQEKKENYDDWMRYMFLGKFIYDQIEI